VIMNYFFYSLLAFLLALFLTPVVRLLMLRLGIVDKPKALARKIHKHKIALGGGWAIFLAFFLVVLLVFKFTGYSAPHIKSSYLLALFLGSLVLMIGGLLDDKYNLSPIKQLFFAFLAAGIVIAFGIGPEIITNPFGGVINLNLFSWSNTEWGNFFLFSNIVVFVWLMGMMLTTKILDGLDGLVTGIIIIGAVLIAALSLQTKWLQPDLAMLALIFAGACLGFLVWNFYPARIFLGQGGSLFLGFILGCLAIISGGKIATTLLVMAVPMLDIMRVIFRRWQKKRPIFQGDSEHLHFLLLQSGLNHQQAVLLLYLVSFLFGITTLFLQSQQKLMALILIFILMLALAIWFTHKEEKV